MGPTAHTVTREADIVQGEILCGTMPCLFRIALAKYTEPDRLRDSVLFSRLSIRHTFVCKTIRKASELFGPMSADAHCGWWRATRFPDVYDEHSYHNAM